MCILLHNNRVGISGNIFFLTCFFLNTSTKFREHYHLNHLIPRLELNEKGLERITTCVRLEPPVS